VISLTKHPDERKTAALPSAIGDLINGSRCHHGFSASYSSANAPIAAAEGR